MFSISVITFVNMFVFVNVCLIDRITELTSQCPYIFITFIIELIVANQNVIRK